MAGKLDEKLEFCGFGIIGTQSSLSRNLNYTIFGKVSVPLAQNPSGA